VRPRTPFAPSPQNPRLWVRRRPDRDDLWTETTGEPPAVYGERWESVDGRVVRSFEPGRSKLAAALLRDWDGPVPVPGERWLYLGAASGTTASHVADLLGPGGRLYAVERSARPFARLLRLAERWTNLLPILGDARTPARYADRVPIVEGIYADVAQPDQVALVLANAEMFLRDEGGALVLALKTSSMGRGVPAPSHLKSAEAALSARLDLAPSVRLDPFYRSHYLVGGRRAGPVPPRVGSTSRWPTGEARPRPRFSSRAGPRRARSRS
jgi:fibrillarin-like pre-rRNA processing protein